VRDSHLLLRRSTASLRCLGAQMRHHRRLRSASSPYCPRRFRLSSALRARTNAPRKTDSHRKSRMAPNRPEARRGADGRALLVADLALLADQVRRAGVVLRAAMRVRYIIVHL
jgi:hypothetical protein